MGTKTGMIKAARNNLGMTEHPPGSNHNAITVWYNAHIAAIGDGAWCDMSVTKEAYDSGNEDAVLGGDGKGFAYVPAHMAWGKAKYGIHHGSVPPAGAVVGYRWDRAKGTTNCDHVGVCEKNNGDGTFYSLEGNIGDAFRREHRDLTYVSCWFMPKYDNEEDDDVKLTDKVNSRGWTVGECLQAAKQYTDTLEPSMAALLKKVDALTEKVDQLATKDAT